MRPFDYNNRTTWWPAQWFRIFATFDEMTDQDRVIAAAWVACIDDDISFMPMRYLTLIGDMEDVFSGSQKQRALLARPLYRLPRILFLDEAISHLDSRTEKRHPMRKLHGSAWKRAWKKSRAAERERYPERSPQPSSHVRPTSAQCGRALGNPKALLGHADGDITTHFSAAEIEELRQAAQRIVNPHVVHAPTLMIVRKARTGVGK